MKIYRKRQGHKSGVTICSNPAAVKPEWNIMNIMTLNILTKLEQSNETNVWKWAAARNAGSLHYVYTFSFWISDATSNVARPILLYYLPSVLCNCWLGHQEEHPVCKNWVMRCWCGYLSGARLFAYGPGDATSIPKPHHLSCHLKIQTGFTFLLVPAYPGCPGKEAVKRGVG